MFRIEEVRDLAREIVGVLDPARLDGRDAARLAKAAAEGAKLLDAATALLAKRAADTNAWRHGSRAASAEQWLAETSGWTEGAAREALHTVQRLDELPSTAEHLRAGELSLAQASHVTAGAIADPVAEQRLLRTAKHAGMRELRAEKDRVIAAATDEAEALARARRDRHLRTWTDGFATKGTFSGPTEDVAKLLHVLDPLTRARFDEARRDGMRESRDAYRFDAMVQLAETGTRAKKPQPHAVRVRVDLPALVRGRTEPGETCEIPGVGPIPVDHAREVLTHGLLQLVITDGVDVQTVVSNTRHVPAALKIAIAERDRTCKIRGCDHDRHLERHHTLDYAKSKRTTYRELGNLCPRHHDLVTHRGHEIVDHHDGTWGVRAPAHAPPGEAAA
jgi:hypothetical protein